MLIGRLSKEEWRIGLIGNKKIEEGATGKSLGNSPRKRGKYQ